MNYETEARNFVIEVESEAARLIALGVPPWDAIIQARQRVSARRSGRKPFELTKPLAEPQP